MLAMAFTEKAARTVSEVASIRSPRHPDKKDVDAALAIFQDAEEGEVLNHVDEIKLRWKIDLRIMPLL